MGWIVVVCLIKGEYDFHVYIGSDENEEYVVWCVLTLCIFLLLYKRTDMRQHHLLGSWEKKARPTMVIT